MMKIKKNMLKKEKMKKKVLSNKKTINKNKNSWKMKIKNYQKTILINLKI